MKTRLLLQGCALGAMLSLTTPVLLVAQASDRKDTDATGRANSPFSRNEADLPKGPAPRLAGHPDLSGYWIPSHASKDKPVGNLGKDLPG